MSLQVNDQKGIKMKELYVRPMAQVIQFDAEDVITTSGILDTFTPEAANQDSGWTGLY